MADNTVRYTDPMEDFWNFMCADPRFEHIVADDYDPRSVPNVLDAIKEYVQFYEGERQTLALEGMEP